MYYFVLTEFLEVDWLEFSLYLHLDHRIAYLSTFLHRSRSILSIFFCKAQIASWRVLFEGQHFFASRLLKAMQRAITFLKPSTYFEKIAWSLEHLFLNMRMCSLNACS